MWWKTATRVLRALGWQILVLAGAVGSAMGRWICLGRTARCFDTVLHDAIQVADGDPKGSHHHVARKGSRPSELYPHTDADAALAWVDQLLAEMRAPRSPPEIHQPSCTMCRWRTQIATWHEAQVTNGSTETLNGLAKTDEVHRPWDYILESPKH